MQFIDIADRPANDVRLQHLTIAAALTLAVSVAAAQGHADAKRFDVPRTASRPIIDGDIGVGEWTAAARLDDLHQVIPIEFAAPSERTIWYLSFDDSALYVAAHAYESDPSSISARILRQGGSVDADDSLRILVDAFNTKRSGYMFGLNPNGVRVDAIFTDGTRQSEDWEGIWRGAAQRTDEGWSIEMEIPFNTLNFDPANRTWGVNLWRKIARRNETIAWQSQNGRVNPTVSGEMVGLNDLNQGKGLDIIPSVSTSRLDDREQGVSGNDVNPSLDVNYKIGNAVNALLTINTDFAATEVDG
ncbi:MAG: carbohydrate binding family 9 domain-containing protein, partial [Woeseiaceae bacterium]